MRQKRSFFYREVKPYVPDARIDTGKRDSKDGRVGLIGCEIKFNRYFYCSTPSRPLEKLEADTRAIEVDIMRMLSALTAGQIRRSRRMSASSAKCRRFRSERTGSDT